MTKDILPCYNEQRVSVDDVEGTPVPISNTEVKLNDAEDTRLVAVLENRKMLTLIAIIIMIAFFVVFDFF